MTTRYLTDFPKLMEQWDYERNVGLDPCTFTFGSSKKVWWICRDEKPCDCEHSWQTAINKRTRERSTNCPFHSNKKICVHTSIVTTHPELAAEWHPTRNGDLKSKDVSSGSTKKIWWLCTEDKSCDCEHSWESTVYARSKGSGCPFHCNRQVCIHDSIATTHPELAAEWDDNRNGTLKPSEVSYGSEIQVWWLCKQSRMETCGCEHSWQTTVFHRTGKEKTNCPFHARQMSCRHMSIVYTHPEIAAEWDLAKNGNMKPEFFLEGSHRKAWWLCKRDKICDCPHSWCVTIKNRTGDGDGCPFHSNKQICSHTSLAGTNPELAEEWDMEKNGDLDPFTVAPNANFSVWWICGYCKHSWYANINSRNGVSMSGCPVCNRFSSKGVEEIEAFMKANCIPYQREVKFQDCFNINLLPFDFMATIKSTNFLIEFDGGQHFKPVHFGGDVDIIEQFKLVQKRDLIKTVYCLKRGIPLIRIPYSMLRKIKEILQSLINSPQAFLSLVTFYNHTLYKVQCDELEKLGFVSSQ